MLAQTLGAMCASAVVYGNYKSAIDTFEGGAGIRTVPGYSDHASAGIFCTVSSGSPAHLSEQSGFI
jgi:aquaglyceroporin related protein, other eukaryote